MPIHKNRHPSIDGAMWSWVVLDGKDVAVWTRRDQPAPGCAPGARIERYDLGVVQRWRIVDAAGRCVLTAIANEPTAHALLAWLCPKE